MSAPILFHLDDKWLRSEGGALRPAEDYPRLTAPTFVFTDFAGALSGIAPVNGPTNYAEALIGRSLRNEGLLDGEARIVVHQRFKDAGGLLALYTAVPVETWQRLQAWAMRQKEDCLLVPQTAALCRLAPSAGGVVFRSNRRLSLFIHGKDFQGFFSALALSEAREDLLAAVQTLARRAAQSTDLVAQVKTRIDWYSISDSMADEEALCAAFSQASGLATSRAADTLGAVQGVLSERIAINPLSTRFNHFAETWLARAGWCAGAAALAFVGAGVFTLWQGRGIDEATEQNRALAREIARQAQDGNAPPPAQEFYKTRDLVDLMASAQSGIDPYAFLKELREVAGEKVKLLRVSVGKEIVIEGWVDQTGGDDRPLAEFVGHLRRMGFSLDAIDTASSAGGGARQSGFFAYRLARLGETS